MCSTDIARYTCRSSTGRWVTHLHVGVDESVGGAAEGREEQEQGGGSGGPRVQQIQHLTLQYREREG
jgi:hypothetical protein